MKKQVLNRRAAARRGLVLLGAGVLACPAVVRANTTYTWSGGNAGTGYFDVGANWAGTAPPTNGPSDLIFGSVNTFGNSPYTELNYNISSITFNASAQAYGIGTSTNGTITVGAGGVTDSAAHAENLYLGLVLSANQTWNVSNAAGSLTLNLTLTNSSSSTLTKIGAGTLNLSGTGSAIGGLNANAGLTQLTAGSLTLSSGFGVSAATLNVSGGAVLNSAFPSIQAIDSGGSMTVTGSGSQWVGGGQVDVGVNATGSLTVTSGGFMSAGTFLTVGANSGANGTLAINSAGTVSVPTVTLGYLPGSTGTATVSGAGSTLNATSNVFIGGFTSSGGTGTLTISNSGVVNTPSVNFQSAASTLNISGGKLNTGYLTSLNNGYGSITLSDPIGGWALNLNASSGTNTYSGLISGSGSLNKSGGATQNFSGLGNSCGQLIVMGGTLGINGGSFSAAGLYSNGVNTETVSLTDPAGGTALTINGTSGTSGYSGAFSGTGTLLKTGGSTQILSLSGSSALGTLSLQGGTTQLTSGTLTLSSGFGVSAATFNVSGGAVLNSAFPSIQAIDSGGSMTVTGSGSQWVGGGQVDVGLNAAGSLTVTSGGFMSAGTFLTVGANSGANGKLAINSAGTVSVPTVTLGYLPGSTGTATVSGSGSILNASGSLDIGGYTSVGGTGTLTISSSGVVNTPLVDFESAASSVNVSGGTLNAGSLTSLNSGYGSITLTGGNVLNINGSSGTNTYSGSISGTGSILKNGAGSQILSGANTFTGLVSVNAGTLELGSGAASGYSSSGGTLQLDFGTFGSATLYSYVGGTIIYNTQTISGGILIGNGTHNVSAVNNFEGTTIDNGVAITPNGNATFYGVSSAGYITNPAGTNFNWDGGTNAGGNFNISGTTGVTGWTSSGVTQINNGGTLYAFNSNLVLLGGSRTYVGTPAVHGGTINLFTNGITLELDGGLLVNNGTITGGTVDVNYAGLATGTGSYSNVVVNPGGTYMPGNYGSGSPLAVLGSPAAMIQPATSGSTSTPNPVITTTETIVTVNTGDTLTLAGGLNASGQSVTLQGGGTLIVAPFSAAGLNVSAGTLKLSPSPSVLSISSLLMGSSAKLDITTDAADINGGTLASITSLAKQGYNGGLWTGAGLTSSNASSDAKHLTAVGVIQNNQGGTAIYNSSHQFLSTTPGASDVLAAFTYYGDTNLDGKIDGTDYSRIDTAYLADRSNSSADTGWFNGDFNYDGTVNGSDYTLMDNAFNTQTAVLDASVGAPDAIATAQIAGTSTVPEPAAITLLGTGSLAMLSRRRIRKK